MDGLKDEWMDGWMIRQTDGQIDLQGDKPRCITSWLLDIKMAPL